jgi:hypothetical protein
VLCVTRYSVEVGGYGLKVWRVDANIRISSSGQPTRGAPPVWRLDKKLKTPDRKKKVVTKRYTRPQTCGGLL